MVKRRNFFGLLLGGVATRGLPEVAAVAKPAGWPAWPDPTHAVESCGGGQVVYYKFYDEKCRFIGVAYESQFKKLAGR